MPVVRCGNNFVIKLVEVAFARLHAVKPPMRFLDVEVGQFPSGERIALE